MADSRSVFLLTPTDLEKFLNDHTTKVVTELSKKKVIERPLTKKEAAAYLRIDVTTLERRFRTNVLPLELRHHNGGNLYFFASELEAYLKKS